MVFRLHCKPCKTLNNEADVLRFSKSPVCLKELLTKSNSAAILEDSIEYILVGPDY